MKTLYRDNKGLHRWLFACGAVLVLFYLFRGNRAAVNFWVYSVTLPFEQFLGRACAALPFSESAPRSAADYRATLRDVLRVWQLGRDGHSH